MSSKDELAQAQGASAEEDTIFDKIVRGDIPCKEVYSDDKVLAFHDVNPVAPVHIIIIPKNRDGLSQLSKARPDQKELLGHIMYVGTSIVGHYIVRMKDQCPGNVSNLIPTVYGLHCSTRDWGQRMSRWFPARCQRWQRWSTGMSK